MPPPDPSFLDTGVGASPHNSRSHTRDGWGAIANALREADEEHIKQYEGDIDTILVFVGLFSAVMTAFLIASYGSLLQDPTTVQTLLLRQIALQTSSYSSNANFLNSTTLYNPQILPEFQPSANAIRVNILWFASLTLSLVSASICIFVKQWLREYLAGEYTSPRARLRVRDSRRKGAEDWYLFEIAAAVPLILQICLGLFLLGLCFFTAEVHNTVGYTTLPLVAGWAFLVIIFIFFPTFSHSCPYKTPLISQWSSGARKFLAWLLKSVVRDDVKKTSIYERSSAARTNDPGSKITTSDSSDFDVLVNIDSSQRDERLLDDLWDAANQLSDVSYERLVSFVHELIRHRDPSFENSKDSNLQGFYDLRSLSKPTVASILSMISKVLEDYMTRSNPNFDALNSDTADSRWMRGCILILLAGTSTPIPENATHVLSKILSNPSYHIPLFKFLRSRSLGKLEEVFSELFDKLQDAFLLIPEYTRMTGAAVDFFDVYFNDDRSVIYSLEGIRDRHPEIKGGPVRQIGTLEILRFKNCTAAGVRDWKPPAYFLPRIVRYLANSDGTWRHLVVEILKTFLYQAAGVLQVCQLASFMIQVEVSPRGVSTMEEPVLSEVEEKIERRWKNEVVSLLNEALLAFDMRSNLRSESLWATIIKRSGELLRTRQITI
ncbi:hypothetical protein BDY19DRAFT_335616 [Irpex rosettiformis]|uniref:Uncharacterized protein n=1 Tax=Irpex rosettiformis TaxID=378272 RepID=A0ACB8TXZ9_9APHY|nr:hypothetical protein BDY19DRAFT_335616 [Irpex rosettiformis]